MSKKINDAHVLELLRKQTAAISLSELSSLLNTSYSERSLRRWLANKTDEGIIVSIGEKKGRRYLLQSISKLTPALFSFTEKSNIILKRIKQPLFKRSPVPYQHEWLDEYQPNKTHYLTKSLQKELMKVGNRSKNHEPAGTYAHHIYNRLLIDLSYHSSRLEGNTYSLLETKNLLIDGVTAPGKLTEEKIMILNHKDAIRYLVDNADKLILNENEIYTLQYLLSDGLVPAHYAGKIRNSAVKISGSTYIPLENVSYLTKQLKTICQKAALIHSPYEKSFFLLIHIAYLQAFIDVNKRTARLSANIPLIQHNLVPLSFNDIQRDDYISAMLAIYEHNDLLPLRELYHFSYMRTCDQYDATMESIGFDEVRIRYRQQRKNSLRFIISHKLFGKKQDQYIQSQLGEIEKKHQQDFIDDIKEDLSLLSPSRIVGLGITMQQLNEWLTESRKYK